MIEQAEHGAPRFRFADCRHEATPQLDLITLWDITDVKRMHCELLHLDPGATVGKYWDYGSPLPSYTPRQCAPLVPGRTYGLEADGSGLARVRFSLDEAGDIHYEHQTCG